MNIALYLEITITKKQIFKIIYQTRFLRRKLVVSGYYTMKFQIFKLCNNIPYIRLNTFSQLLVLNAQVYGHSVVSRC